MDPRLIIIVANSLLWAVGLVPAFGLRVATAMGGSSPGAGSLGVFVATAGFVFPAVPIISVIGSWAAYLLSAGELALLFAALPWLYLLVLGVATGLLLLRSRLE